MITVSYLDNYFNYHKPIFSLDLSREFDSEPDTQDIRTAAEEWLQENAQKTIPENIDISVLQMDGEGRSAVSNLNLCDTLTILYPDLEINVKAKVTKTVFNVLIDRYDSISVGTMTNTMNNAIKKVVGIK